MNFGCWTTKPTGDFLAALLRMSQSMMYWINRMMKWHRSARQMIWTMLMAMTLALSPTSETFSPAAFAIWFRFVSTVKRVRLIIAQLPQAHGIGSEPAAGCQAGVEGPNSNTLPGPEATGLAQSWLRFQAHFEEFGPAFAGDEQTVTGGVIGNSIQYIRALVAVFFGEQSGKVDDADDLASRGIYAHNKIGAPDIGEDLAFHVFQLIQSVDGLAMCRHGDPTIFFEGRGVKEADLVGAIAHNQPMAVGG